MAKKYNHKRNANIKLSKIVSLLGKILDAGIQAAEAQNKIAKKKKEFLEKKPSKFYKKPTIKRKLFAMEKIKYSIIKIILSNEILAKIPCAEKSL